jgi:uncharacterized protein
MVKQKLKRHIEDLRSINSTPHEIALGFALGTFVAILPTFGLGVLIGVLIIFLKKDVNKLALFAAFAVWNPIILVPINTLAFHIGDTLLQGAPIIEYYVSLANQVFHFTRRLLIGNIILSTMLTGISYYLVKRLTRKYQTSFRYS